MPLITNTINDIIANADAMKNAAYVYFNAFIDAKLEPFKTHIVLISVIAAAELSLGVGIWLESPKKKSFREWFGLCLVLGGCVASAIVTVALVVFDEGISRNQQADIKSLTQENILLNIRATPRELDVAKFRAALSKAKKPAKVELRYQKDQPESWWFAMQIDDALMGTGWQSSSFPTEISLEDDPPPVNGAKAVGPFMSGLRLLSKNRSDFDDPTSAAHAMEDALLSGVKLANQLNPEPDPRLPDDTLKILVSPRVMIVSPYHPKP
jgi:hypothetical protein